METVYPEDIIDFLYQSGFDDRRIDVLKANIITSFSNPKTIADIISYRYPRLLHHSIIRDANSSSMRLEYWRLLNKTLSVMRCELSDDRIINLGNKRCTKEEIFSLLRVLKMKLDAYEPLYLARFNGGATASASRKTATTSSLTPESSASSPRKTTMSSSASLQAIDVIDTLVPPDVNFDTFDILENIASAKKSAALNGDPAHFKSTLFGSEVKLPISKILASGKSLTMKYDNSVKPVM